MLCVLPAILSMSVVFSVISIILSSSFVNLITELIIEVFAYVCRRTERGSHAH
jgi:hypothetical protein